MKRFSRFIVSLVFASFICAGSGSLYAQENSFVNDASSDGSTDFSSSSPDSDELSTDSSTDSLAVKDDVNPVIPASEPIASPLRFDAGENVLMLGFGIGFPTSLSYPNALMDIRLEYQYILPYSLALSVGAAYQTSFTYNKQLIGNLGVRYYQPLPLPVAMVYGVDFTGGGLLKVRNAYLGYLGARLSVGSLYYLRTLEDKKFGIGLSLNAEIGSSISQEHNYPYATIGLTLTLNYHFK